MDSVLSKIVSQTKTPFVYYLEIFNVVMIEKNTSVCEKAYVNFCKFMMFAIVVIATVLAILFTPSNPIFKAAYEGRIEVIRDYVSEGGSINAIDKWNNTALHWSAKGGQMKVMKFLVNNGIDVNAINEQGENALHWSVFSNNKTVIEYLAMQKINVNSLNNEGETALHLSIILNAFKSAQTLLHLHADPNIVAKNGNTALHYMAPGCGEDEQCRNLIEEFKNAGCNFTIRNEKKFSVMEVIFGQKVNETISETSEI